MKKLFVILSLFISIGISSCKKEGTVTVYVKKQLPGQALQYAAYSIITVYTADSVTQVAAAEASEFGVAAIDLKEGDYLVTAAIWNDTSAITGQTPATVKKGERTDVNVTIQ